MGLPGEADREITVTPLPDEQPLTDPNVPVHQPAENPVPVTVPEREKVPA
jgi:hypothetical protein